MSSPEERAAHPHADAGPGGAGDAVSPGALAARREAQRSPATSSRRSARDRLVAAVRYVWGAV
ncbi:hypothetical protein [Streptomyces sp. NPDC004629]|uniref:hypothetical protein n=1 Tax=Streptomyces sp. NPDC004629 TaxID=3364705 RepID=UPI0036D03360